MENANTANEASQEPGPDHLIRAIDIAGGQAALGRKIGVVPQVVNNWIRRGNVPAEYCPAIERALDGKVRCEDLRPDVDWAVLRKPAA